MSWLIGNWMHLGAAAGKAALMYGTALIALRLGERRTLAQWTITDFIAAVAVGAIVGRTAIASTQSFVTGAVALVTLIVMHRVVSGLRFHPLLRRLTDHRIRVLVAHGAIRRDQLAICGLTEGDLLAQLRQRGVFDLSGVRFVLYEAKGGLTIVPESRSSAEYPDLVDLGLREAAGFPARPPSDD
ncbi:DUF421 domain-containing protein [Actinoallomurus rhizosphaericola]|uniref:DUF421 domain-containing protein n=1 Tax=Actinoallomurus rhizosphaericola TaxID=2952536 RepID=UPI0020911619|nr:YetF domain-containing protein [Actinoallomurus rhizosphaericola]MCO5992959.1 DUF421 domain-containing protein [Actinoallomurus rhizosphaericola]